MRKGRKQAARSLLKQSRYKKQRPWSANGRGDREGCRDVRDSVLKVSTGVLANGREGTGRGAASRTDATGFLAVPPTESGTSG